MDTFVNLLLGVTWTLMFGMLDGRRSGMATAKRREKIIKGLINESEYDNRIPPNYEDDFPTSVTIQIYVLSFDTVSEASMDYSATIFLREHWVDNRLQWKDNLTFSTNCENCNSHHNNTKCMDEKLADEGDGSNLNRTAMQMLEGTNATDEQQKPEILERLEIDPKLLDRFWMPDLYFINDKKAIVHDVTVANRLLHIYRDGTIRTSSRISLTLSCDMLLTRYPHDEQTCSMYLGSYSFSAENVVFVWHDEPIILRKEVLLPRFIVELGKAESCDFQFTQGGMIRGNYTCIRADFNLRREFGYYIAQVYVPSCLIVVLSWVSFWIDLEAIPARVSLGLLTVLTMTTQSTGEKASLPRVSYLKAIDVWMAGCLVFVFAALLEFAFVNVQSRVEKRRQSFYRDRLCVCKCATARILEPQENRTNAISNEPMSKNNGMNEAEVMLKQEQVSGGRRHLQEFTGIQKARMADKCSRVAFPFSFLIFNIIYWMIYLVMPN